MERAIAYCRVSDPRQVKDEGSLDRQEQEARDHALRKGYKLVRVFIERGESAKTGDRTALKEMLQFAKAGKIGVLIIPKIDRLARNSHDYLTLKVTLSRFGTRIESVGENIDDSPVGRFLETILSGAAQFDNEIKAERSRNGMIDAFKQGRWIWRAPYGYEHRNGNIVPKEPEASQVRLIFELSRALPPAEVLRVVRQQGFPLMRSRLHEILASPVYAGWMQAFGMEVKGSFEPLVPERYLYRPRRYKPYEQANEDFPLKEVCRCCGPLTGAWSRGRSGVYAYYRCRNCGRSYRREVFEQRFLEFLDGFSLGSKYLHELRERLDKRFSAREAYFKRRRSHLERALAKVRETQRGLVLKTAAGVIPDDLARVELARLRKEEAELQDSLETSERFEIELSAFAEDLLTNPSGTWRKTSGSNRSRFQKWLLPEGATVNSKLKFGTKKIRLLEPARRLVQPDLSGLEPHTDNLWNQLYLDLADLRREEELMLDQS